MAADEQGKEGLQPHPLIDKLMNQLSKAESGEAGLAASSEEQLPNVQVLSGYLARDPQPEYWRLYEDLNLNSFLRIAESDIVGSQQLATEQEPSLHTIVWVRQDAMLQYTRILSQQVQAASFLQGTMMSGFMQGSVGSKRESRVTELRRRQARYARGVNLEESVDFCQTFESGHHCVTPDYGACYTRPAYCRSDFDRCPTDLFCPSEGICPPTIAELRCEYG